MSRKQRRAGAGVLALIVVAFLSLGCTQFGLTFGEDSDDRYAELQQRIDEDLAEQPEPRDSRLAEGEIYRVHLTFGTAMSDGGWYSVEIENPRNSWRDFVRWDCLTDITEFEEDYRNYDFPFMSDNFNAQDPAQMDGEYILTVSNGFGYEELHTLTWSDGQFTDGGYAEYAVP